MIDYPPPNGRMLCVQDHVTSFKFGEISDNISETAHDRIIVQCKTNRKSYVTYRMAPLPVTLSDSEGHFRFLKPFCLIYLGKYSVYYLLYVYSYIGKPTWLVISTIFLKTKDCPRSQPVTYTVNVVISRKRRQIASLLLRTTNRKWYIAYRIETIPMTLSHFKVIPTANLSNVIFVQLCNSLQYFNYHIASRGSSAVAERLVITGIRAVDSKLIFCVNNVKRFYTNIN